MSVQPEGELEVMKWVSSETDPEFDPDQVGAQRSEKVYYKVRVRNETNETIDNIVLIDRIPFYVELDNSQSLDDDADKQVRWVIGSIRPGASRTFITEMRVREDSIRGDEIISYATASWDNEVVNSNDVVIDVERGTLDDEEEDANADDEEEQSAGQGAFIFGAGGFFPETLLGWLLLLLIVFAVAYVISRIFFTRNENARVLEELKAQQAAKVQS